MRSQVATQAAFLEGEQQMFQKFTITAGLTALALTSAVQAMAGGFFINLTPPPYGDQRFRDAAFVVNISGCVHPKDVVATATAEGLVNGERKTVQLKLTKVEPGIWMVKKEWASEGSWILFITGGLTETPRMLTRSISLGPGGRVPVEQRKVDGKVVSTIASREHRPSKLLQLDVDGMLKELAGLLTKHAEVSHQR
jgi:hypothetical protein